MFEDGDPGHIEGQEMTAIPACAGILPYPRLTIYGMLEGESMLQSGPLEKVI
jgi:hypothetical protein